jgi:hypothetical protein
MNWENKHTRPGGFPFYRMVAGLASIYRLAIDTGHAENRLKRVGG